MDFPTFIPLANVLLEEAPLFLTPWLSIIITCGGPSWRAAAFHPLAGMLLIKDGVQGLAQLP